jgi:hypothetical protein
VSINLNYLLSSEFNCQLKVQTRRSCPEVSLGLIVIKIVISVCLLVMDRGGGGEVEVGSCQPYRCTRKQLPSPGCKYFYLVLSY